MSKNVANFFVGAALTVGGVLLSAVPGVGALGLALTSLGLGVASRALFGPAKIKTRNDIRENLSNPLANLPIIYGTAKVGLRLVDVRTGGTDNKKLYLVGALCHGSQAGLGINAVKRIWFDERLAFDASGTLQVAFKKGATSFASYTAHLGTEAQSVDSTMATEFSTRWTTLHRGRGVAYLVFVLTYDKDIYQSIPNITVEVEGAKLLDPRESDVTYSFLNNPPLEVLDYLLSPIYGMGAGRRVQLGSSAVTNSGMGGFTAANVVDGDPNTKAFDTDGLSAGAYVMFDMGHPVEIDGVDLWMELNQTPTQQWQIQYGDTAGGSFTTISVASGNPFNPAVERRTRLRWPSHTIGARRYWRLRLNNSPGASAADVMGVEWFETEIDYQSFADEANTADTLLTAPPSESTFKIATSSPASTPLQLVVPVHGYSSADRLHIALAPGFSTSGLVDSSGPVEGRTFDITVIDPSTVRFDGLNVTGTYVANSLRVGNLITEPQFQSDGALDSGQEPQENLRQLLSGFRGRVIYQGGKFRCHSKKTTSTTLQLTDEDIRSMRWIAPGTRERVNTARAAFLNKEHDWQPDEVAYPPVDQPNAYLAADNGFPSGLDMDLPLVNSPYQANRLAQVAVRESRDGISIEMTTGARGMLAQVGDVLGVTYATPGWSQKPFWVERVALSVEDQPILTLVEYEPNAYLLDDAQLQSSLPNTDLPDATAKPAAPTGLTLTAGDDELILSPNGDWLPRIRVAWTPSVSPFGDYVEVQAKRSDEVDYDTWGRPPASDTLFFVSPVTSRETWDVQIRVVTILGVTSDWLGDSITVAPITRAPARGVVEYFEDFPGSPARWTSLSGSATPAVVATSDAQYGGKVLQCANGDKSYIWSAYIPFDRAILYSLRARFRQLRQRNGVINGTLSLGLACYDAARNQIGIAGAGTDLIAALFNAGSVSTQAAWTDVAAYLRGWNGAWYAPPASALTNGGFTVTSLAAAGDGDVSATSFDWTLHGSGSNMQVDLGVGVTKRFCRIRLWLAVGVQTGILKVQYSDNASSWTDITFRGGGTTWTPSVTDGWNEIDWDAAAIGSHRYWRLLLTNSAGAAEPSVNEFQLLELLDTGKYGTHNTWPDPYDPCPLPPGTAYVRPFFAFVGDGTVTDAIQEIDVFEFPLAAGATALL